ncbi:MAG: CoA-acylating methylmalonate-semialdehyde dehydrogenase [Clostridiales bacterium]|nr:CoA-acylating methylmalonate-semialdehyde dehydrogenase [Clostridiales bacterium]
MTHIETLQPYINGEYIDSKTTTWQKVFNPSTGEEIAKVPCCTEEEVAAAIAAAKDAFPTWQATPVRKRVSYFFKLRELIVKHMDELTMILARENGKNWSEAAGDVGKALEMTELACSATSLLMGESLQDTSTGYDTVLYREALGVCAGIAPWNFPAMIPMGWMTPLSVVCGNTFVLKPASTTPMTSLRFAKLYEEAGFPKGVINVVPCTNVESEFIVKHPDVKAITFVGSTAVGRHVYATAAAHGKRVQALCEAKNHALVLKDAPITRTAAGIMNSSFGCAGQRCMALPVVVVEEEIADQLVEEIIRLCQNQSIGPAYDKATDLGPVGSASHKQYVFDRIEQGVQEGATLVLDGRNVKVEGYEDGYYIGHTIFDHVSEEMNVGQREIFGPVLCIKRVKNFEEGLEMMNRNPFGNGSVIFTQNGYYAREFTRHTHGGMVGVNVGIPVPMGAFPFTGHKESFFGDLHCHGKDAFRFYTEEKTVTSRWFDEDEMKKEKVDSWDGSL